MVKDDPHLPAVSGNCLFEKDGKLWVGVDVFPEVNRDIYVLMSNGSVRTMQYVGFYADPAHPAPERPILILPAHRLHSGRGFLTTRHGVTRRSIRPQH